MLPYITFDVSERIDTNETGASKECMLCHNWYFKDVGFKLEPYVCNKCQDVLMTVYELKNMTILNVKGVDFRCILSGISRDEAVNRLNKSSIVTEVIRTVYYYYHYYFIKIFCTQKKHTQALFKYLNTPKKQNKEHKQLSFRCKAINFCSNICLKKI